MCGRRYTFQSELFARKVIRHILWHTINGTSAGIAIELNMERCSLRVIGRPVTIAVLCPDSVEGYIRRSHDDLGSRNQNLLYIFLLPRFESDIVIFPAPSHKNLFAISGKIFLR